MTLIELRFRPEFRYRLLSGEKTATSRRRRAGQPGDYFEAFGETFKLLSVEERRLEDVATLHYRAEGCESPKAFIDIWNQIHPWRGYEPELIVFYHSFCLVKQTNG